jgi:Uma2 family endonuclease
MAVEHVEEFWQEYAGKPFELIEGKIIETFPKDFLHGATLSRIGFHLGGFVDDYDLGDVVSGTGFQLGTSTICGTDVAFVSSEKLAQVENQENYLPFAPDLAVEVVSPNNTADEIQEKVKLYLDAGTSQIWVSYPTINQVVVHYPDDTSKRLTNRDVIDGGDVLPGFSASVADFFLPQP